MIGIPVGLVTANAEPLLARYRNRLCTFNDDIQGTAAVILGTILAAVKAKGEKMSDQVFLGVGSGSAFGCISRATGVVRTRGTNSVCASMGGGARRLRQPEYETDEFYAVTAFATTLDEAARTVQQRILGYANAILVRRNELKALQTDHMIERKAAAVGHNRADMASMVDLQVRRAWNDRSEAESRLQVAESAVDQASENLRVVRNRYEAGASTNADVLDAEALREQSMSNLDNARFEVELAKLRLARAIGAL